MAVHQRQARAEIAVPTDGSGTGGDEGTSIPRILRVDPRPTAVHHLDGLIDGAVSDIVDIHAGQT